MNNNDFHEEIEELKKEMGDLKEELARERDNLKKIQKLTNLKHRAKSLGAMTAHFADTIQDYVSSVMDSVTLSLEDSMGKFVIGSNKRHKNRRKTTSVVAECFLPEFYREGSNLLSSVADENRLKLLKALEFGGRYQKELSDLTEIRGGNFNHHITKLQDANFVIQEAVRGRYLITMEGREASKLVEFLYLRRHPDHAEQPNSETQQGNVEPAELEDICDENDDLADPENCIEFDQGD